MIRAIVRSTIFSTPSPEVIPAENDNDFYLTFSRSSVPTAQLTATSASVVPIRPSTLRFRVAIAKTLEAPLYGHFFVSRSHVPSTANRRFYDLFLCCCYVEVSYLKSNFQRMSNTLPFSLVTLCTAS